MGKQQDREKIVQEIKVAADLPGKWNSAGAYGNHKCLYTLQ